MNSNILNTEIQEFISSNLDSDITKLVFKGSPFNSVSIKEIVEQIEAKKKCKNKLPTWYNTQSIYYPNKLNIEQTSSEVTAKYKASLISGKSIIDITGGFGVDAYYFSDAFDTVTHCEINEELQHKAKHNFSTLKKATIKSINSDGLDYLLNGSETYDWIYADPSRRHDIKGKVFYLKDCLPNIPEHLNTLFEFSQNIMLKVSPMLDISIGLQELQHTKSIHIISVNNEVKELLYILEKDYSGDIDYNTVNITKTQLQSFSFNKTELDNSTFSSSEVLDYLYEPNASILKSGAFKIISQRYNIHKLHQNTHLYTSTQEIEFPGRKFKVIKTMPYNKKLLSKELKNLKHNISTRNFPEKPEQLKKNFKIKDGGDSYVFFTTDTNEKKIVIFTHKQ